MKAQLDMAALLPSERAALRGYLVRMQSAEAAIEELQDVTEARAKCGLDEVLVLGLDSVDVVTRADWRSWTGREAPPVQGATGVPVLQLPYPLSREPVKACFASWALDEWAGKALVCHAHEPSIASLALRIAASEGLALVEAIAAEQLAFRLDQADRRAASAPAPSVAASTGVRVDSTTAPPRKLWEDLTSAQTTELQRRSPAVFERLLADYRERRARGATR